MSALTRFLQEEVERLQAVWPERQAKMKDWQEAVKQLMTQLAGWIRDADPKQLIRVNDHESQWLREAGLGYYAVPRLLLEWDTQRVWVVPKARNVVAFLRPEPDAPERQADGLVIITDAPPSGDRLPAPVYNLYRLAEPTGDRWFIRHPLEDAAQLLDRDRFEAVMVGLFR